MKYIVNGREVHMRKKTPDYDNVFKTMKMKHKRLFVSVINDVFGKNYPKDVKVDILQDMRKKLCRKIEELAYFRDEMLRLYQEGELPDDELIDLKGFVNTIITHIANGNKSEERLVNVMGGTVIETESERLIRLGVNQGQAQMIVELGQEYGLNDEEILHQMQEKIGLSFEQAMVYFKQYGKQLV